MNLNTGSGVIVKSKQELIDISKKLNPVAEQEKMYRFAENFLLDMKNKGNKNNKEFFDVITYINENAGMKTLKRAVGISGKVTEEIQKWCGIIKGSKMKLDTDKLDVTELSYVMGYCARIAKYEYFVWKKNNQSSKAGNNYNNKSKPGSGGRRNGKR